MKQKRSRLFVDSAVQGSLARRIGLHWFVFFVIVVSLQCLTTWMVNPVLNFNELISVIAQNNGLFLIAVLLLLPSFVFDSVKLSNRFAGPMVRLRNVLNEAGEKGELKKVEFREGDFWSNMADAYNSMVETINEKLEAENSESNEEDSPRDYSKSISNESVDHAVAQ